MTISEANSIPVVFNCILANAARATPRWLFLWPGIFMLLVGMALFVPLSISPVQIGQVQFNTNTLLVAGMMVIVGFQVLFFGVFTKLYCVARGLLPESLKFNALMGRFSLERGLVAGLLVFALGLGFLGDAVWKWKAAGFGHLDYAESLRLVIPAVTCLTLAVQAVFSSFFLSILELKHD